MSSSGSGGSGTYTFYIYSRGDDGALTLKNAFELGSSPGGYPGSIVVSADGNSVYVKAISGENSFVIGVHGFMADADGTWSPIEGIDLTSESDSWQDISLDPSGKYFAALTEDTLYLYTVDADGSLKLISQFTRDEMNFADQNLTAIKFSGDGKSIYVQKTVWAIRAELPLSQWVKADRLILFNH